jgi:hypothetical protein
VLPPAGCPTKTLPVAVETASKPLVLGSGSYNRGNHHIHEGNIYVTADLSDCTKAAGKVITAMVRHRHTYIHAHKQARHACGTCLYIVRLVQLLVPFPLKAPDTEHPYMHTSQQAMPTSSSYSVTLRRQPYACKRDMDWAMFTITAQTLG